MKLGLEGMKLALFRKDKNFKEIGNIYIRTKI